MVELRLLNRKKVEAERTGFEPATSGLTGRRSDRAELPLQPPIVDNYTVVGGTGLEPVTSGL